jgi:tellurite resistance protein
MRTYAKTRRTLADIPLTDLSADDRRLLIQHAVLLTFIDGAQSPEEKTLLTELCEKLRIPANEATSLLTSAETRAKRFLDRL